MLTPTLTAYLKLIPFGSYVKSNKFAALHTAVRNSQVRRRTTPGTSVADLCRGSILPASGIGKRCSACNVCGRDLLAAPHEYQQNS